MAFVHGKDSYFAFDATAGGSLTEYSSYVDEVDGLPGDQDFDDVTSMGDEGHKNIPGLEAGKFTVGGAWDATLDAVFGPRRTVTSSFAYGPAGSTGGLTKYSGECWIENYTVTSNVTGAVRWKASCLVDGQITRGTF